MTMNKFYELAMDFHYLYSICQQKCDGMDSCKMSKEPNNNGCLKWFNYYHNLAEKQNENLKD